MRFNAEYATLVVDEREHVVCPRAVRRAYRTMVQIVSIVFATPIVLTLFACILHVPILSIVLILMLVGFIRLLERPLTRQATRVLWPVHAWWIRQRAPERLTVRKIRDVRLQTRPADVEFDPETGRLSVGAVGCDLSRPYSLTLERADGPGTQLRLRLFQAGAEPLVLAARIPEERRDLLEAALSELPRREGSSVVLDWVSFRQFVTHLRRVHGASAERFPPLLERICAGTFGAPAGAPHLKKVTCPS